MNKLILFFLLTVLSGRVTAEEPRMYVNTERGLIVREQAGMNFRKLTQLPFGSEVRILESAEEETAINGKTGKWVKIKTKDQTGWVFDAYLSKELPEKSIQRIPNKRIELFLKNYNFGKLQKEKKINKDECSGEFILRQEYEHNAVVWSSGQYQYDYLFIGRFKNVLGISNGNTKAQVLKTLGNPYSVYDNKMEFLSEKPEGYESEYFKSRWTVVIFFKKNKVTQVRITELFDDC